PVRCVCFHNDPGSVYPVVDPLRVSGLLPHSYAYGFAWDAVQIDVEDAPSLTNRQIMVGLVAGVNVSWAKEIDFWNYCRRAPTLTLHVDGSNRGPVFGLMNKGCCREGVQTVLLKKAMALGVMTGLYTLNSQDLFTFWGGK